MLVIVPKGQNYSNRVKDVIKQCLQCDVCVIYYSAKIKAITQIIHQPAKQIYSIYKCL